MILSKGHGCIALYVMLAEKGFIPYETLDTFCRRDSILGGHPEAGKDSRRRGLDRRARPRPVLSASAWRWRRASRSATAASSWSWATARSTKARCGKRRCAPASTSSSNLTAVVDYNKIQSAGPTREIQDLEPLLDKWRAFNFAAVDVDGHDVEALRKVFERLPLATDRPSAIICHTVKGKGIAFAENDANWHHKSKIANDVVAKLYAALE